MSATHHQYNIRVRWTGNTGSGTRGVSTYSRDHVIFADGKEPFAGSSDPAFRGDASRYNPEELLVAALSQCHMLWYLGLCAGHGIVVTGYEDAANGTMQEHPDGSGEFTLVTLHPRITLAAGTDVSAAEALHEQAHHLCFIARSVNFPVEAVASYHQASAETGQS